jgi:protein SCO1/2
VRLGVALALAWLVAPPALAHDGGRLPPLDFEPPAAGTYTLHRIMAAPDGEVLDVDGRPHRLRQFTRERITLLGLVYTTCADPDGCPLA